jgi:hypothetical protein
MGSLSTMNGTTTAFTAGSTGGSVDLTVTAWLDGDHVTNSTTITITTSGSTQQQGFLGMGWTDWIIILVVVVAVVAVVAAVVSGGKRRGTQPPPQAQPQGEIPPWPQYGSASGPMDEGQLPPGQPPQ